MDFIRYLIKYSTTSTVYAEQSISKLVPFTMLAVQQIAVPDGAAFLAIRILLPVVAQVVETVTAVVPLAVTVPEQADAAVAS